MSETWHNTRATQVRALDLATMMPSICKSVTGLEQGNVGSTATIEYADGAKWAVKLSELSDVEHKVT